jgi:hypothetical protein
VQNRRRAPRRLQGERTNASAVKYLNGSIMVPAVSGLRSYRLAAAPRAVGRALVKVYRFGIAPLIGMNCRHLPTCSEYADEALDRYGLWAGGWMTLARLLRCHPWGTHGLDFVPQELPARARWYLPWRYGRWRGTNSTVGEKHEPHAT